jgi:radical SAM superfamily enzyme YgiQ (UPF0313 family)
MGKRNSSRRYQAAAAPLVIPDTPVLYIHPAKQGSEFRQSESVGRPYGVIPVGVAALVNRLRDNGIRVKGINHALEIQLNPLFNLQKWLKSQTGVKVILIDLHWYEHCYGAVSVAKLCKQVLPRAFTVLGGLSASGFAREILENFPEVDFILRGDAESPLVELTRLLLTANAQTGVKNGLEAIPNLSYRNSDGVVENELGYTATEQDLDSLNFVDIDFLEHAAEYHVHEYIVTDLAVARQALQTSPFKGKWITTARGCKFECSYCGGCRSAHKLLAGRNGIVLRSPERVVDDLARLQAQGVIQASMTYDIAELGEEYWRTLFAGMRERGIKIGLYNEFFQMPDLAFVEDLAQTVDLPYSCVALSPLSGNERVRRLNGKHYSNEQFFNMLATLDQYKLYLFVYFSLNLPGETRDTFQDTLMFAKDVYEFYPSSRLKMLNTVHTIDPLAPMNERAEKYGIQSGMKSFMEYYHYCERTQNASPLARSGSFRGFEMVDEQARSLQEMADMWDRWREGREKSWWPIPPSW